MSRDLNKLRRRMNEIERKETHTARDLAEVQELIEQFLEHLEELERTATVKPYLSGNAVADKVLSYWRKDG